MPKGFLGVAYDIRRVTEIFDVKYLKQESECMKYLIYFDT
jgi:hypothetical protein